MAKIDRKKLKDEWDKLDDETRTEILESLGLSKSSGASSTTIEDIVKSLGTLAEKVSKLEKGDKPEKSKGFFDSLLG